MARIHGKNGQVKMDPLGGSSVVTVADLNGWTLTATKDRVDVTCFGDTNKQSVVGLPDFSGTINARWNSATSPAVWQVILGNVAPFLNLIPNALEPTYLFKGLAYLDGNMTVDSAGAVTYASNWSAAGNWVMAP